jgi:hypothetical protein
MPSHPFLRITAVSMEKSPVLLAGSSGRGRVELTATWEPYSYPNTGDGWQCPLNVPGLRFAWINELGVFMMARQHASDPDVEPVLFTAYEPPNQVEEMVPVGTDFFEIQDESQIIVSDQAGNFDTFHVHIHIPS